MAVLWCWRATGLAWPLFVHNAGMAAESKITIRVRANRGSSVIRYSTTGRYISLHTNGVNDVLMRQPILTTASSKAFWEAVLPIVLADIESLVIV